MLEEKNKSLVPIIIKIKYQFINNIESDSKGSTSGSWIVNLKNGIFWKEIIFSPGTADFKQNKKKDAAGDLFEQKLQLSIPGEDSNDFEDLSKLDILPVLVNFEYSDGSNKIIGTLKNPAEFLDDYSSNSSSTKNTFSFNCKSTQRAYSVEEQL